MKITVRGEHKLRRAPELAHLSVASTAESGSRSRAVADATRAAQRLADDLASLAGVERYSVEPVRVNSSWPSDGQGRRLPERVVASVNLTADFTDFEQLAAFTARAGAMDAVRVGWVGWSLTDATGERLEEEALTAAIASARRRALAMARAEGADAVEVEEISDPGLLSDSGALADAGPLAFASPMAARSSAPELLEIVPQDVEVVAAVHVRFRTVAAGVRPDFPEA